MGYKWKPSKGKIREFKAKMNEIDNFCIKNGISNSLTNDSYYFIINGQKYRVSNHTIEASNRKAFDRYGSKVRDCYHGDKRDVDTIYIHASKTRLIEIYNDLKNGYKLDGRGFRKGD